MGFFKDIVSTVTGGLSDYAEKKAESDLNQRAAREAAEKNRDISIEMFNMQKQSNLEQWEREKAYNLELWNRNNEYNSPAAQMTRLKEAGLNPRLMYGEGTVGNASPPPVAQLETPEYDTPSMDTTRTDFGVRHTAMDYMGIKQAGLQNQNLAATNSLIMAQADKAKTEAEAASYELDNLKKTGGSKLDPTYPRWFLRMGGKLGDWVDSNVNRPIYDVLKNFTDRGREFFVPIIQNKTFK